MFGDSRELFERIWGGVEIFGDSLGSIGKGGSLKGVMLARLVTIGLIALPCSLNLFFFMSRVVFFLRRVRRRSSRSWSSRA